MKVLVDQLDDVGNVVDVVDDVGDVVSLVVSDVWSDVVRDVDEDVGNVCAGDDACHVDGVTGDVCTDDVDDAGDRNNGGE